MGDIFLVEGNNQLDIVLNPVLNLWKVSVSVRDNDTMERISGAIVTIIGFDAKTTVNGFCSFYDVPEGTYQITAVASDYISESYPAIVVNEPRAVSFYLSPS